MKICPEGAELFHADGGTDRQRDRHNMMKLIVTFRNFAKGKAVKKGGMQTTGLGFFFN